MKLSAITVMTTLSIMMLGGCGDNAVKNFKDLHPGISFESASEFLDKYEKDNRCKKSLPKLSYWLTCPRADNLGSNNISGENVVDSTTYVNADTKSHIIFLVERSAQLKNKAEMDRAFDEIFANARKQYGHDGWSEQTTEPQSTELHGKTVTFGVKSTRMTKRTTNEIKTSISKSVIYSPKWDFTFSVAIQEEGL